MVQAIPTSGGDLLEDALQWLGENVAPYAAEAVDMFNGMIFGIPAPGKAAQISTWVNPTNGWWGTIFDFYVLFAVVMYVVLFIGGFASFGIGDELKKRQYIRGIIKALFQVIFGFYICALVLHAGDIASTAFIPSGAEFMQTPGDVTKLGLGLPVGIVLLIYNAGVVLFGILSVFLYYLAIHVLVAAMPLFITLRQMPQKQLQAVGNFGISAFVVLIFIRVFQSIVLRITFEVPWDGIGPALITGILGVCVGISFAFVIIPVAGFYKLIPNTMMMISTGVVASKATQAGHKAGRTAADRGYNRYSSGGNSSGGSNSNNSYTTEGGWSYGGGNGTTHDKKN